MRRKILLPRALACCLLVLFATVAAADAVDTYLRAEMANQRLPGVAVAVLRDGKPVSVMDIGVFITAGHCRDFAPSSVATTTRWA